jgi:hypothetical protein
MLAKGGCEIGVVGFAGAPPRLEDRRGQAEALGGGDSECARNVGDDDGDFDAGKTTAADGICDGEEV